MARTRRLNRALLLGLSLLSGCAAGNVATRTSASNAYGAYLIGRFAQDTNNLDVASTSLLLALRHDPQNQALLNQAFLACMLDARPEAAALARQLPTSPIAQLLLGNTAAAAGDWREAQTRYAALTSPGLTQYLAPLLIAWTQQGGADTDAALATLLPKLDAQPLAGLYALHAALIADLGNRYAEAQRLYGVATTDFGGLNLQLATVLANWEVRQGHVDDANEALQSLGRGNPSLALVVPELMANMHTRPVRSATDGLAEVYLSFAAELKQQNDADTSLALLRLALDLRPDLTAARLMMADTLAADKHADSALRSLSTVGNQDPLAALVRLRRAQLEASLGDIRTATAGLRQLAAEMPDRPEPLAALADLQRNQKQLPAAIATYDQAIARVPPGNANGWPLLLARAASEQESGNWPHAESDLRRALQLAPDEPEVLNFLGYAWADRNEHLPEARTMLARAAELRPNDGAIIDSLGWVMLRQGDVADAVKSLERAAQMEPEDPEINGHLGDAYWAAATSSGCFRWRARRRPAWRSGEGLRRRRA
jgi:tetratricopeptide (TPR) repeat protein